MCARKKKTKKGKEEGDKSTFISIDCLGQLLTTHTSHKTSKSTQHLILTSCSPFILFSTSPSLRSGQVSARIPVSVSPITIKHTAILKASSSFIHETTVHTMNVGETLGEAVGGDGGDEHARKAACVTEQRTELLILNQKGFVKTFKVFLERREREKMEFLREVPIFGRK